MQSGTFDFRGKKVTPSKSVTAPQSATNHFEGQSAFPPNNKSILDFSICFTIRVGPSLHLSEPGCAASVKTPLTVCGRFFGKGIKLFHHLSQPVKVSAGLRHVRISAESVGFVDVISISRGS